MTSMTTPNAVTKRITVHAPQQRAFEVFTQMTGWWQFDTHHTGDIDVAEVVMEPRPGGRWYERGIDDSEQEWGQVLSWDPYQRLLLGWQLDADFHYDPEFLTEVEVTFVPDGNGGTEVALEHRNLERYGDRQAEITQIFETGGWPTLLERYAAHAAS
jgi:uncharacterized protein YndB with AHSA1/START domain